MFVFLALSNLGLAQPSLDDGAIPEPSPSQFAPPPRPRPPPRPTPRPPPKPRAKPVPTGWVLEPFIQPHLGVLQLDNGTQLNHAWIGGILAGIDYEEHGGTPPRFAGQTCLKSASVLAPDDTVADDLRLATNFGAWWSELGAGGGIEAGWSRASWNPGDLAPSASVTVPLYIQARVRGLEIMASVEPSWFIAKSRRVDWSQASLPGLGDEV
ncbi:MAG: hypothetical protein QGG40_00805, partial [Myxococcota bacterium]|nr:hypothetical protein [Myxococcota bacterium]